MVTIVGLEKRKAADGKEFNVTPFFSYKKIQCLWPPLA
jgi:hypothetical protein